MSNLSRIKIYFDNLRFTSYTEDKTQEKYEIPLVSISRLEFIKNELSLERGSEHINLQNMIHWGDELSPEDLAILLWENRDHPEVRELLTTYISY